jgi:hypothetical protein
MTNVEMLASLRSKLDEATASFWTDIECYRAFSDAQIEVISLLPIELVAKNVFELTVTDTVSATKWAITRPTMVRLQSAILNNYPAKVINNDSKRPNIELNTFMTPTTNDPIVYELNNTLIFEPSEIAMTNEAIISYIPIPSDITSSASCSLIETSHPAIVQYAYAVLLKKANRLQESANEFGLFIQMLGMIK